MPSISDDNGIDEIREVIRNDDFTLETLGIDKDFRGIIGSGKRDLPFSNYITGLPQTIDEKERREQFKILQTRFLACDPDSKSRDLGRLFFLSLNLEDVLKNNQGSIAELGVYKGNTASVLAFFAEQYNRKLFLFDTFEGFVISDKEGIDKDIITDFKDTSMDYVKRIVGYEKGTIYKKGHFPETIDEDVLGESFSTNLS